MKFQLYFFSILFLFLLGCEERFPKNEVIGDPIANPQFVFMRESNILYFAAHYELEFEGDTLDSQFVEWYGQGGELQDTIWLNDQGISGDIIAGDGLYSSEIINNLDNLLNTIDSTNAEPITCTFVGLYGTHKINIDHFNYKPIIKSLIVPDSIYRPQGEEIEFLLISAEVIDSNGLSDISICGFTSKHVGPDTLLNNGKPIWLYDDGGAIEIFSSYYSGDEVSGDGKFSFQIPIFGPDNTLGQTKTGTFLWTFVARDNSFEASNSLEHIIVVE